MSVRDQTGINAGDPTIPRPLEGLARPPAWTEDALCAQVDPELFFPERGGSTREAKAVCANCTVAAECLDYALEYESGLYGTHMSYPAGIYGGLSERQRRTLRAQLRPASNLDQESA